MSNALLKPVNLSPVLASVVGVRSAPRTEVTKKIWAYIKANSLQNPKNKREIICDAKLKAVFNVPSINMFAMTKKLNEHMK